MLTTRLPLAEVAHQRLRYRIVVLDDILHRFLEQQAENTVSEGAFDIKQAGHRLKGFAAGIDAGIANAPVQFAIDAGQYRPDGRAGHRISGTGSVWPLAP